MNDNILFYEMLPCAYFVTEVKVCTYFAWTIDLDKLKWYYLVHPERAPNIVYIFADTYAQWTPEQWSGYCDAKGYNMEPTDIGNYMMRK